MTEQEEQILEKVKYYVKKFNLDSKSRDREASYIRFYLYNYLNKNTNLTTTMIGEIFKRSHCNILYGLRSFDIFKNDHTFNSYCKNVVNYLENGHEDDPYDINLESKVMNVINHMRLNNSNIKCKNNTYARFILYNLLREKTKKPLSHIGSMFNRHHSTVANGLCKYKELCRYSDFVELEKTILSIVHKDHYEYVDIDVEYLKSEIDRCKDPVYFYNKYVVLKNNDGSLHKAITSDSQENWLRMLFKENEDTKTDTGTES